MTLVSSKWVSTGISMLFKIYDIWRRFMGSKLSGQIESIRVFETLEEEYMDLFENSPDMSIIASVDVDKEFELRIMRVNQTFLKMTGFTKEELLGKHMKEIYPDDPGSVSRHRPYYQHFLNTGEIREMERRLLRKDGSSIDVSLSATAIRDKNGKIRYGRTVWRDISKLKATQFALKKANDELETRVRSRTQELASSEEKYRRLFESALDPIVVFDRDGIIHLGNKQLEHCFGYKKSELTSKMIDLLIPNYRAQVTGLVNFDVENPDRESRIESFGRRQDGTQFPIEMSLSPVLTEDGLRITAIIRDITERFEFERSLAEKARELVRSNSELERFAYVASHDLREPLRMVTNYAQLLERRYKGQMGDESDKFISYMIDGVQRMQQLISDLLAYSRVGRTEAPIEKVDMSVVAKEVMNNLSVAIEEAAAEITIGPLPIVPANHSLMRQLLQNLVSNAIKFRKQGVKPQVQISVRESGDRYVFSVSDNGIGIEPQYASRIFVIFQRLHNRLEYPGTGIGLAICKKIVELANGSIWMKSKYGEGATFYFSIPKKQKVHSLQKESYGTTKNI